LKFINKVLSKCYLFLYRCWVFTGMDDIDKHTLTNQSGRWMCAVRHLFLLVFHIQLFYDSVQCIRFYSYLP